MPQRQIPYNNAAATLRYEYDPDWDPQTITGVTLTVTDLDGTELLAAAAATLWTATTLSAAAAVGETTITLTAATLAPGDRLSIAASADGPHEKVRVKSYNSSTKVATLDLELRYGHASGTNVKGAWATYDIDTSTVATFPVTQQMRLVWTPAGSDDLARTEEAEISKYAFGVSDFEPWFRRNYPTESEEVSQRGPDGFGDLHADAVAELQMDLSIRGFLLDRLVNQSLASHAVYALARRMVVRGGGDNFAHEQKAALEEYQRKFEQLCNLPIWTDDNQDGIRDAAEIDNRSAAQLVNSERQA